MLDGTYFEQENPTETGALDNMVSANYVGLPYNVAYRMAGFFVAPMSGNHIFTVAWMTSVLFTLITVPVLIAQITKLLS